MAVVQHSLGVQMQQFKMKSIFFKGIQMHSTTNARGCAWAAASALNGGLERPGWVVARTSLSREVVKSLAIAKEKNASIPDENLLGINFEANELQKKEEELVKPRNLFVEENCWTANLGLGPVGRYAFFASLVFGAALGCSMFNGDAEAAMAHLKHSGGMEVDMRALALGPEGPLLEEFWENVRRYLLYFLTVVTGGISALLQPVADSVKNPISAVLITVIIAGSVYLIFLTVSAMLGISGFQYEYAV